MLSALTQTPGLAMLAYGKTGSIPAALAAQKSGQLASSYLQGTTARSGLKSSLIGGAVNAISPEYSGAFGFANDVSSGWGSAMDYASSLQAAGVRPRGDFYADPVSARSEGNEDSAPSMLASYSEPVDENNYGQGFYTNPYEGNLASYYKMFGSPFMA